MENKFDKSGKLDKSLNRYLLDALQVAKDDYISVKKELEVKGVRIKSKIEKIYQKDLQWGICNKTRSILQLLDIDIDEVNIIQYEINGYFNHVFICKTFLNPDTFEMLTKREMLSAFNKRIKTIEKLIKIVEKRI